MPKIPEDIICWFLMGFLLNGLFKNWSYELVSIQHGEPIEGKILHFHGGIMEVCLLRIRGSLLKKAGEESVRYAG